MSVPLLMVYMHLTDQLIMNFMKVWPFLLCNDQVIQLKTFFFF